MKLKWTIHSHNGYLKEHYFFFHFFFSPPIAILFQRRNLISQSIAVHVHPLSPDIIFSIRQIESESIFALIKVEHTIFHLNEKKGSKKNDSTFCYNNPSSVVGCQQRPNRNCLVYLDRNLNGVGLKCAWCDSNVQQYNLIAIINWMKQKKCCSKLQR